MHNDGVWLADVRGEIGLPSGGNGVATQGPWMPRFFYVKRRVACMNPLSLLPPMGSGFCIGTCNISWPDEDEGFEVSLR